MVDRVSTDSIARQDGDTKTVYRGNGGQQGAIMGDERPKRLTISWTFEKDGGLLVVVILQVEDLVDLILSFHLHSCL